MTIAEAIQIFFEVIVFILTVIITYFVVGSRSERSILQDIQQKINNRLLNIERHFEENDKVLADIKSKIKELQSQNKDERIWKDYIDMKIHEHNKRISQIESKEAIFTRYLRKIKNKEDDKV